jgi:hypothetical protein
MAVQTGYISYSALTDYVATYDFVVADVQLFEVLEFPYRSG